MFSSNIQLYYICLNELYVCTTDSETIPQDGHIESSCSIDLKSFKANSCTSILILNKYLTNMFVIV